MSGGAASAARRGADSERRLLPRLFFQHFTDTSWVIERLDGELVAFLVGFVSSSQPGVGYIHFVGVHPALRRSGVGRALYDGFADDVAHRGVRTVRCITSPTNTASLAFHTRLGFDVEPSETAIDGIPVQPDYDGPGLDRIAFVRRIAAPQPLTRR